MSKAHISSEQWNPWKLATLGMAVVFVTALVTGAVVANYVGQQKSEPGESQPQQAQPSQSEPAHAPPVPAPRPAAEQHAVLRPTAQDIEACNHYASSVARDKTKETITDALIGGALGAGMGAAGGAIAGGGGGAGKGAGIGGLVGATAGTLYGLNQGNQNDARATAAYRSCMRKRGYTG